MARAQGGSFFLRFEDTDLERSKPEYMRQALDDLAWLGITWDAPPLMQSENLDVYNQSVEALSSRGLTYPCRCSRKVIAAARAAPQEGAPHSVYPQTCKTRSMDERGPNDAIRLHIDGALEQASDKLGFIEDWPLHTGPHPLDHAALLTKIGDIVVWRKDIQTAGHCFASALADICEGGTHGVRGVDLFDFTQVQVLLLDLLGHKPPRYFHHDLIRDENGKRLAKRDDARAISLYRSEGASPQDIRAMIGL